MATYSTTAATPAAVSELVSVNKEPNLPEPIAANIDSGPVQAYAKLEGDDFCYYIRTLQVSLGRKVTNPENIDIPLGHTKSVSRQHARLYYNFSTQRFELVVFGKNGAFVNERFIERGMTVPLDNKTKIQIGEMAFIFLLPKSEIVSNAVNVNNSNLPVNNDNNCGYISTPLQLERNMIKLKLKPPYNDQPTSPNDDDISDNISEVSDSSNLYNSKDVKPPYSYASLIAQAIKSCQEKKMTLNGIYNYITTKYPYYQMAHNGWQNSIRHNLSLNKAFIKVPRLENEPGKGAFWSIDMNEESQLSDGKYKRNRRPSNPTDPTNVRKKSKKNHKNSNGMDGDNIEEQEEDIDLPDIGNLENLEMIANNILEQTTQSLLVADTASASLNTLETDFLLMPIKVEEEEKPIVIIGEKLKETIPVQQPIPFPTAPATNNKTLPLEAAPTPTPNHDTQMAQKHMQQQLQTAIRQHLLDPVKYPLPTSIAELLPQAITQLPPQLANQLSSKIKVLKDAITAESTGAKDDKAINSPATDEAPTETNSSVKTESTSVNQSTTESQPTSMSETPNTEIAVAATATDASITPAAPDAIIVPNDDEDDIKMEDTAVYIKVEE